MGRSINRHPSAVIYGGSHCPNFQIFPKFAFCIFQIAKILRISHTQKKLASKDITKAENGSLQSPEGEAGRPFEELFPPVGESSILSVACFPVNYSASQIARAVEDCDVHLLNLNLTSECLPSGEVVVDLRVGARDPGRVARSLERYGYTVVRIPEGPGPDEETMRDRVNELLRIINF